ncbi:hypothetical protein [Vibrio vulnificus]|uniref:hypothetical protein n=1 Tax=Vibrio vulnificus TaxID=672 RepID=UPI0012FB34B8|nr:hypothetical protein [Vibrio vulnificus]MVT23663.1 hypothetical protein [Vibrio vulnificus]
MLEIFKTHTDEETLFDVFSSYMDKLLKSQRWQSGSIKDQRVVWSEGASARKQDAETFNSRGIYIWGGINSPIYVGKTTATFNKRFSRYIWSKKSQCNLASEYGPLIEKLGVDGFPNEIRDWYRKGYGNSLVRLNGAVRFAKEDIQSIWFTLLPIENVNDVGDIERKLIRIAQKWNSQHSLPPLLNIEFNTR